MTGAAEIGRFRAVLSERLGWVFDDNDAAQLGGVLARRAETAKLNRSVYLSRLARGDWDTEMSALAAELTINETYFFRHGEQFQALTEVVLPERVRARANQRVLRMLSVGCSSGEEAYTLAIVAREVQPDPDWIVAVLGLDASPAMIQRAGTARFSAWSLRETPDAVRQRWFRPVDGLYELAAGIRSAVQFQQYNVATANPALWAPDQYDVVFCRNLLMYLTPDLRAGLIERMTRSLAAGGYLFLGHTDSLGSRPEGLEPVHSHRTFYYRRGGPVAPAPRTEPADVVRPVPPRPVEAPAPPAPPPAYDRAFALLHDERFAEALTALERGLGAAPPPRELLLHGVLLAQAGRLADAEAVGRRLLDADGLNADAHHQLGVCLEGGGGTDGAISHYRLAAYLDPEFAMPRLRLGLLARRRGENRMAGAELERALGLLRQEREDRLVLFGGGFGRIALTTLCRAELDACGAHR
ncbi:protein-glutamate O-methyltransferase CheR [Actinoplanes sp. N902-109]|uniref:CheR family methyltransferase n=1 Tax=Actinoplanes sp. (strain N902-109) TaxID=649831 RepID=UPI0003295567|nr:CheR family methyltransferase [Actinoplanes sp. N902-109]AGL18469.1 protein-glutamate O-methyltransferase [Actinoplanes sp. N902-109]